MSMITVRRDQLALQVMYNVLPSAGPWHRVSKLSSSTRLCNSHTQQFNSL